jgi:hypothetical protein
LAILSFQQILCPQFSGQPGSKRPGSVDVGIMQYDEDFVQTGIS